MNLDWIESVLFGLVSGLTEFLPVSAQAHQALLLKLFGASDSPLLRLLIHGAILLALYQSCAEQIGQLLREQKLIRIPPRRRRRQPDMIKVLDMRLLRSAAVMLVLGFLAYPMLSSWRSDLYIIAPMLVLNGLILYIPMHMANGNKDARSMSQLEALLLGLAGAFAVLPGISRVGTVASAAIARGADKEHALRWSLLLSIPALLCLMGFDVYGIVTGGIGALSLPMVLQMLLSAAAAFGGAYGGIRIMRFMAFRVGFSGFSYYCWGVALFSFLMYLTV